MPFNIGPLELVIVLVIALLVVGPKRLPEMGNSLGKTIREFRKASTDVTDAVTLEPEAQPVSVAQPAATAVTPAATAAPATAAPVAPAPAPETPAPVAPAAAAEKPTDVPPAVEPKSDDA